MTDVVWFPDGSPEPTLVMTERGLRVVCARRVRMGDKGRCSERQLNLEVEAPEDEPLPPRFFANEPWEAACEAEAADFTTR